MATPYRMARGSLHKKYDARRVVPGGGIIHHPMIHRQLATPYQWHMNRHRREQLPHGSHIESGKRGYATASTVTTSKLDTRRAAAANPQSNSSRAVPSFQSKAPASRQLKNTLTVPVSEEIQTTSFPASPHPILSPLPPSPSAWNKRDQILILSHFRKPTPMFVRGIRHKTILSRFMQTLQDVIARRPEPTPISRDNIPRLGDGSAATKPRQSIFFRSNHTSQHMTLRNMVKATSTFDIFLLCQFVLGSIVIVFIALRWMFPQLIYKTGSDNISRGQRHGRFSKQPQQRIFLEDTDIIHDADLQKRRNRAVPIDEAGIKEVVVQGGSRSD